MASKTKPTLLLIHGLRGNHHGLKFLEDELKNDFKIINIDLPGSGASPELPTQNLDSHIKYLHQYVTALPTKPIIVAHSMGSIIASRYASKYPDDSSHRMILIAPILRGKAKKAADRFTYYLIKSITAPFTSKARHKLLASKPVSFMIAHILTYDKSKQKFITEQHYLYSGRFASAKSLLADLKISMTSTAIVPKSKQTLIIIGSRDQLTSPKKAKQLAVTTTSEYHEISDTGHLLNYEKPQEVANTIRDFLKSPARPSL